MPLSCFPPTGPSPDAPLPSAGSAGAPTCPDFDGTIRALRLPAARPAALRFLRLAVPSGASVLRSHGAGCYTAGLGTLFTRPPTWPTCSEGDDRASHVPGEPSCAYALLFDPGGTVSSGHNDRTTRPPPKTKRRLPATPISELNHTASALAVYASQGGLLRHHAKLASSGLARPTGGIRYPQGSGERFQSLLRHLILLSQAFHGARFVWYI
jgi:hypothetical protein